MHNIILEDTRELNEFRPILEGLVDDFGYTYYHAILTWCKVIHVNTVSETFWQVWVVKKEGRTVGICGLYSLKPGIETLWLGWFGILPEYRNLKIGEDVLKTMEDYAKAKGCRTLRTYVDENGKPLSFYFRNGFKTIGIVSEIIEKEGYDPDEFEGMNDYVLEKT